MVDQKQFDIYVVLPLSFAVATFLVGYETDTYQLGFYAFTEHSRVISNPYCLRQQSY